MQITKHNNNKVVVFGDANSIKSLTAAYPPTNTRRYIELKMSDFTVKNKIDWKKQESMDSELNRGHSSTLYQIWNEKIHFVTRVIDSNPYNTERFAWIDAGYFREPTDISFFSANWPARDRLNQTVPASRVTMLEIEPFLDKECENIEGTVDSRFQTVNRIGGGMIWGDATALRNFAVLHLETLANFATAGVFAGKDQSVYAYAILRRPSLFNVVEIPASYRYNPWHYLADHVAGPITAAVSATRRPWPYPRPPPRPRKQPKKIAIDGFGVLYTETTNIGDYIQTIAAMRLLPRVDFYVVRDRHVVYDREFRIVPKEVLMKLRIALLVNGWFLEAAPAMPNFLNKPDSAVTHHGWFAAESTTSMAASDKQEASCRDGFPRNVAGTVYPLLISMHISDHRPSLYSADSCNYYKKHGPVGARDLTTLKDLARANVPAYFSSCLTLTLGMPPSPLRSSNNNNNGTASVAANNTFVLDKEILQGHSDATIATNAGLADDTKKSTKEDNPSSVAPILCAVEVMPRNRTTYPMEQIRHQLSKHDRTWIVNSPICLQRAQALLKRYQRASHVITDRLHAYLPCLSYHVPRVEWQGLSKNRRLAGMVDTSARENLVEAAKKSYQRVIDWSSQFDVVETTKH